MSTTNEPVEIHPLQMDKADDDILGDFRVLPVRADAEEPSPKDSSAPASAAPSEHEVESAQTEQAGPTAEELEAILKEQATGKVPSEPIVPTSPTSPPAPPAPPASVAKVTKK